MSARGPPPSAGTASSAWTADPGEFAYGGPSSRAASSRESVQVFARVRPPTIAERESGDPDVLTYGSDSKGVTLTLEDGVPHNFRFNRVFAPESSQDDVYHFTGRPVVESVLNGFNAAVLCYGQVMRCDPL